MMGHKLPTIFDCPIKYVGVFQHGALSPHTKDHFPHVTIDLKKNMPHDLSWS